MSDSRHERALAEYWAAVRPDAPLPELPRDPVDAFIEIVDQSSQAEGAFHLLDATSDPYPGIAVADRSKPWRIVWALQIAELEPFASESLPEITFYLDTLPDPGGSHRVYSHEEGAPGPYEFADIPDALRFMAARVKHARGELDDALLETLEAETSTILEDEYESSAASGFFVFENVLEAPLPEAWEALSTGKWPEIELMGKPKRVDKRAPSWQRELSLRTLGLFLRDRRVVLPDEVSQTELRTAHRRLVEHLKMIEEALALALVPELVETLALDGPAPLAELASAWMKRFDEAHGMPEELGGLEAPEPPPARGGEDVELPPEAIDRLAALLRGEAPTLGGAAELGDDRGEARDEEHDDERDAPPEEAELTPFMRSMRDAAREAIAALVADGLVEIDPAEHEALSLEMAHAAAEARSAKQMLESMTRALVDSDLVEEVYASDDDIERCLQRLMSE